MDRDPPSIEFKSLNGRNANNESEEWNVSNTENFSNNARGMMNVNNNADEDEDDGGAGNAGNAGNAKPAQADDGKGAITVYNTLPMPLRNKYTPNFPAQPREWLMGRMPQVATCGLCGTTDITRVSYQHGTREGWNRSRPGTHFLCPWAAWIMCLWIMKNS